MLTPYFGGLTLSGAPLELDLNFCSHRCAYCFANIGKPDRKAKVNQVINLLADFENRDSIEAKLLRDRYPVLFSNKIDPFAETNYRESLPLIDMMTALEIPLMIQSRGGKEWETAAQMMKPGGWYISICQQDDSVRKKIEPGAPTIEQRLSMAEKLLAMGWCVDVGINPFVHTWIPNPKEMLRTIWNTGVRRLTIAPLHMSRDLVRDIRPNDMKNLGEDAFALGTSEFDSNNEYARDMREEALSMGFHVWNFKAEFKTNYYDGYKERYPKLFPQFSDFVNHCHDTLQINEVIDYDFYANWMCERLPKWSASGFAHYLGASNHEILDTKKGGMKQQALRNFRGVFDLVGVANSGKIHPIACKAFSYLSRGDNIVVNDRGIPLLVWSGQPGREEWYVEAEEIGFTDYLEVQP